MTSPFIVAGMQRTGTSTMAKRLAYAGVNMGPEKEISQNTPTNPGGFWEDPAFRFPTRRLEYGSWDLKRWKQEFEAVCKKKEEQEGPWGWKDPRIADVIEHVVERYPWSVYIQCWRPPSQIVASNVGNGWMKTDTADAVVTRRLASLSQHLPKPHFRCPISVEPGSRKGWKGERNQPIICFGISEEGKLRLACCTAVSGPKVLDFQEKEFGQDIVDQWPDAIYILRQGSQIYSKGFRAPVLFEVA